MESGEAVLVEAAAPAGDGIGVAVQFLGDLEVGGLVRLGAAEDEARAEGQPLGGGRGAGQLLEQLGFPEEQVDGGGLAGHR
jgi:hypothetical protein